MASEPQTPRQQSGRATFTPSINCSVLCSHSVLHSQHAPRAHFNNEVEHPESNIQHRLEGHIIRLDGWVVHPNAIKLAQRSIVWEWGIDVQVCKTNGERGEQEWLRRWMCTQCPPLSAQLYSTRITSHMKTHLAKEHGIHVNPESQSTEPADNTKTKTP